ncbi:hypothetical protein [Kutzneria sp. NPDC052558]|uniref:hypothetical protein n=1 Tax=Kutzneria sp. NPDC052558 TaxID=3364121 RepID=UPI0037C8ADB0
MSDIWALADWTLIKANLAGTARVAAENAVHNAEVADDRMRQAAALRCAAEVEMSAGAYPLAIQTALAGATELAATPADHPELAVNIRARHSFPRPLLPPAPATPAAACARPSPAPSWPSGAGDG